MMTNLLPLLPLLLDKSEVEDFFFSTLAFPRTLRIGLVEALLVEPGSYLTDGDRGLVEWLVESDEL